MRLLFYLHQFPAFGGIETVTVMLANALSRTGFSVRIVSFVSRECEGMMARLDPHVTCCRMPSLEIDCEENKAFLSQLLIDFTPDFVVFQDSYARIEGVLLAALKDAGNDRCRLVVVEHSRPMLRLGCVTGRGIRRIIRVLRRPYVITKIYLKSACRRTLLYGRSTAYVVLSPRYIPRACRLKFGWGARKMIAIPNPVDDVNFNQLIGAKEKIVLYVGTLTNLKGVDSLLRAWCDIERFMPEWRFVLVGDGDKRKILETYADELRLRHVEFVGYETNPASYFARAPIMVMHSAFEGWPMVLGEGMSYGCVPVVTDSYEAVFDIVENGVSGIIAKHQDEDGFADELRRLMSNDDLCARYAKNAKRSASRFRLDAIAETWRTLLQGLKGREEP